MAQPSDPEPGENLFAGAGIQNADISKLTDAIDYFRELGIEQDIALPQLVVVGDQSVGKSSLLETLTGLPFPVGLEACTRFAVEVALKRKSKNTIQTSISPSSNTDPASHRELLAFGSTYPQDQFNEKQFLDVFSEVSGCLGIPPNPEESNSSSSDEQKSRFSEHMLRIEASNDTMLSFIDTPGIYHTGSSTATISDMDKVKELVTKLIRNERAIIIVVADARLNIEMQAVFQFVQKVDPHGRRTVGVLTKSDLVTHEFESTKRVVDGVAKPLKHGWYAVRSRNKDQRSSNASIHTVRKEEEEYFQKEPWNQIEQSRLGSSQLKQKLGDLYASHLRQEFPKIMFEIKRKIDEARKELDKLGPSRSTTEEQLRYLLDIAARYETQMRECLTEARPELAEHGSKIRMRQKLAEELFSEKMKHEGSSYKFLSEKEQGFAENIRLASLSVREFAEERNGDPEGRNENIFKWINRHCNEKDVPSVCGLISQELVNSLFRTLIEPWEGHSQTFFDDMFKLVTDLTTQIVKTATENGIVATALAEHLCIVIENDFVEARSKANEHLDKERLMVYTTSNNFPKDLQKRKAASLIDAVELLIDQQLDSPNYKANTSQSDRERIKDILYAIEPKIEPKSKKDAVFEIHDILETYYPYAMQRYLDNVGFLGKDLTKHYDGPLTRFNSHHVRSLTSAELEKICGESEDTTAKREMLLQQVDRLEKALKRAEDESGVRFINWVSRPATSIFRFGVAEADSQLSNTSPAPGAKASQGPNGPTMSAADDDDAGESASSTVKPVKPRRKQDNHRAQSPLGRPAASASPSPSPVPSLFETEPDNRPKSAGLFTVPATTLTPPASTGKTGGGFGGSATSSGHNTGSVFATPSTEKPTGSFGGFGGFGGLGNQATSSGQNTGSLFTTSSGNVASAFGSAATKTSIFGQNAAGSGRPPTSAERAGSPFGASSTTGGQQNAGSSGFQWTSAESSAPAFGGSGGSLFANKTAAPVQNAEIPKWSQPPAGSTTGGFVNNTTLPGHNVASSGGNQANTKPAGN